MVQIRRMNGVFTGLNGSKSRELQMLYDLYSIKNSYFLRFDLSNFTTGHYNQFSKYSYSSLT